jgi:hypothetical protein
LEEAESLSGVMMARGAVRVSDGADLSTSLPGRRYDRVFFSAMAFLILATVVAGFAPSYYFAGLVRAPLPSTTIRVHAAVFSCWLLLLITQTSLVAAGRLDVHRRLGNAGFLLACLMVVLGLLAATDALIRGVPPGGDPLAFYMVSIVDMVVFPTLVFFAFRTRFNPQAHKRLILVATIALTPAAIARLPFVHRKPPVAYLVSYILLLLLVAYDLWSRRKIHRATLLAGAFLVFMHEISGPIAETAIWHAFAGWVQSLARG